MQRIVQINIAGRVIPIEEDAYLVLKDYLNALERQFVAEEGKDEIIQDIEYRIAELFGIRLQNGAPAIDKADVQKVTETLGPAHELTENPGAQSRNNNLPVPYVRPANTQEDNNYKNGYRRIYRDPDDKWVGGVCSGFAHYFDIDPLIVRLIFAAMLFLAGIGLIAYIIAWIVIPQARTTEDYNRMNNGAPMDFDSIAHNMGEELQDLKRRGEKMSRDLQDFFNKKK